MTPEQRARLESCVVEGKWLVAATVSDLRAALVHIDALTAERDALAKTVRVRGRPAVRHLGVQGGEAMTPEQRATYIWAVGVLSAALQHGRILGDDAKATQTLLIAHDALTAEQDALQAECDGLANEPLKAVAMKWKARAEQAELERDALRAMLDGAEYEHLDALLAEPEPRRSALARAVGTAARARTLELIAAKEQAERTAAALRELLAEARESLDSYVCANSDIQARIDAALAPTCVVCGDSKAHGCRCFIALPTKENQ
jgi:hypothetical protein